MSKAAIALAILCATFAQLSPFTLIPIMLGSKSAGSSGQVDIQDETEYIEEEEVPDINIPVEIPETEEPEDYYEFSHEVNYEYELFGYGTFSISTDDWVAVPDKTDETHVYLTYRDNGRSKLEVGYVTGIKENTDINGYIANEIAKIDTRTNDKYNFGVVNAETGEEANWMCIPALEQKRGLNCRVYYLLSETGDSAIWMRTDVYPDTDDEDYALMMTKILSSVSVYYIGNSYETPSDEYYEDATDNSAQDQGEYQKTGEDNKVFQYDGGFTETDLPSNWDCMQVQLNNNILSLPCTVSDLIALGYNLPEGGYTADYPVPGTTEDFDLQLIDDRDIITLKVSNAKSLQDTPLADCMVSTIILDKKTFRYDDSIPSDYIVLPGGITLDVYTDDVVTFYGKPLKEEKVQTDDALIKRLTYVNENKKMVIDIGMVSGISRVEISMGGALEENTKKRN